MIHLNISFAIFAFQFNFYFQISNEKIVCNIYVHFETEHIYPFKYHW